MLAALFGALHDQISYTVAPEYYTRFKFEQFAFAGVQSLEPRVGAAVVGILATWWVGLYAGILVAGAGLLHRTPRAVLSNTMRAYGLIAIAALALGLGGLLLGWFAFDESRAYVDWWRPSGLSSPHRFFAAGMMHNGSYLGGALGVLIAITFQVRQARRASRSKPESATVAPAG